MDETPQDFAAEKLKEMGFAVAPGPVDGGIPALANELDAIAHRYQDQENAVRYAQLATLAIIQRHLRSAAVQAYDGTLPTETRKQITDAIHEARRLVTARKEAIAQPDDPEFDEGEDQCQRA